MHLSVSTNVVFYQRGDHFGHFVPVEQCMVECLQAGFRVFDINCCDNADPGMPLSTDEWESWALKIANIARSLDVSFNQSHNPIYNFCHPEIVPNFDLAEEMTRRSILCSGILGVKWIVVHAGSSFVNGKYDKTSTIEKNLAYLDKIRCMALASGCEGIAIENMAVSHDYSQICETTDGLIHLVDAFHSNSVGVCWDFGHAHLTSESQFESLQKVSSRLKATHIADNSGLNDDHTLPMLGTIPWEQLMPVLQGIAYQGDLTYEIHKYMWNAPAILRPIMLQLAHETGQYLIKLSEGHLS